ncbi:MAG: hypothetical protein AAF688_04395 [Bacteroidota bacterium]
MLKAIFDFYIMSSFHVALAAFSLSYITLLKFGLPFDEDILFFIFFASVTGYNFVKFFGLAKFHHRSLTTRLRVIRVFSFFSFLCMAYFFVGLKIEPIMVIAIFALITFLYAVPILPKRLFMDESQRLRSISGLKIYLIALVWSGVTVILPLVNADNFYGEGVLLLIIQIFLFVLAVMLPFEIRDLNYDSLKLATIPQKIGITRTKILGLILLIAVFILEMLNPISDFKSIVVTGIIAAVCAILIIFSRKNQNAYYTSFFVEGLPTLWLVLILVF